MNDDELRRRIAGLDPAAGAATDPITSPKARALLEEIMNTPLTDNQSPAPAPVAPPPHKRNRWLAPVLGAAAAVVAVLGVAIVVNDGDDGEQIADAPSTTAPPPADTTPPATSAPGKLKVLELDTGVEDTMAMCMVVSAESIAQSQVAFKGTAQTVEGEIVTLTIDQAYAGTDAQMATLVAPDGMQALIGGIEFVPGQQYLITAYDGVVNYCGHSGPATPELQALFDQAFPA